MKKFQRKIENFVCVHCGFNIKGTGYTNHCPKCLYSQHVDINPGDRLNQCKGIMQPVGIELKSGEYIIKHQCQKCREIKNNKVDKTDDMDTVINLAKTLAENI